jgi:ATP-dependent Clp protease protease subunit
MEMEMPKIQTRLEAKMLEGDAAELYLYGVIRRAYPWEEDDACISSKAVQKALQGLTGKNVNVHINSPGGSTDESIAICNLLRQHDGTVNVYVDSMAGSGASVVAMAGEKVFMFSNCMMFIHNAWTIAEGNAAELRKIADDLDKISTAAKQSYMGKFVGTEEELDKLMAEETYLTAEECLAFGLCSEIIDAAPPAQDQPPQTSIKTSLFAKYQKPPAPEGDDKKPSLFNLFKK